MTAPEGVGQVLVVAAVIRQDGRYLLGRRPERKRHGGLWEFPGGKVLADESGLDAARRELAEELALEVVGSGDVLFSTSDHGSPFVIEFLEVDVIGVPQPLEHSELAWLTPEEMEELPLAPADARFAATLGDRRG